jgi:pimeloyl-ACP methyl ester carboxylesterase
MTKPYRRAGVLSAGAVAGLATFFGVATLRSADEAPWSARDLAQKVQLQAEPSHPFRYNQGTGPYGSSTMNLLERRRAFFPGEKVRISFRLPREAKVGTPLEARAAFALQDLDGGRVQDAGEATLHASATEVTGTFEWTVPDAKEGSYFLAARFFDADKKLLATRSEIVFLTQEYPRLLDAVEQIKIDLGALSPLMREVSLPSTMMLIEDAKMRWYDFGRAPRDWEYVKRQLTTARDYAQRLVSGEDPYKDKTGLLVKAYHSDLDDTLQPYALYVPKSYDSKKAYPLLVSLHGATSNHLLNRRRVFGLGNRPGESDYEAIRNEDISFPDVDFIVLTPYGRGEVAGYNGIAEQDVLRAMDDVERAYNVDKDRVYLTGLSMGGGGTWHLGLRYPDRFAAIAPVCALGDLSLFPFTQGMGAEDRAFFDLTGPSVLAENAANLQVFIFHGDEDPAVSVEHSRRMVARYRDLGLFDKSVHYFELPGVHHFAWDFAYRGASIFARLAPYRRNPFPDHVAYSTFSPRFNKAYWLRIDRIDRGFKLARIEGTRRTRLFEIKTENLSAFSLLLDPALVPKGMPLELKVNGEAVWRGVPPPGTLSLSRGRSGRWIQKPWVGPAVGPPDHAEATFRSGTLAQSSAHVYVYGTAGDAEANAAARKAAETLADWGPNVRAHFSVVADTEVTPELMASHNLVLVGNAALNRVVARLAEKLPIRQDATGTFAGTREVSGPDASFRLHCANPLAPGRYVLVYGAGSEAGLKRFLPPTTGRPLSPYADYLVIGADGQTALEGYFKDDWTIPARP